MVESEHPLTNRLRAGKASSGARDAAADGNRALWRQLISLEGATSMHVFFDSRCALPAGLCLALRGSHTVVYVSSTATGSGPDVPVEVHAFPVLPLEFAGSMLDVRIESVRGRVATADDLQTILDAASVSGTSAGAAATIASPWGCRIIVEARGVSASQQAARFEAGGEASWTQCLQVCVFVRFTSAPIVLQLLHSPASMFSSICTHGRIALCANVRWHYVQAFCEWTEGDERQLRQAIVACRRRVRHMSHVPEALIPTWHRMLQSHTMAVAMLHATNEALASDDSVSVAHAPFEPSVFSIRLALSQKWNVSVCDWVETFPLHDADNFLTRALRAARAYLLPVTRHTMLSSLLSATTSRRRHRRMVVLSNWLAETATTANLDTMIASPSF
ncbi:hypothetical protein EON66_10820, partial [archaeon]